MGQAGRKLKIAQSTGTVTGMRQDLLDESQK